MSVTLQVAVLSKTPYKIIDGQQFCVWCYQLSWDSSAIPQGFSKKVGLVLSAKLDIKDPASFPDVIQAQGTQLTKQPGNDQQYVYKDAPQAGAHDLEFFFIAPSAEDSFTPVLLVTSSADAGPWKSLPFRVDVTGEPSPIQAMRGPAVATSATTQSAQPATAGKLSGASRRIPKCTYVPLKLDVPVPEEGSAVPKFAFLGGLGLQPGEADAAMKALVASGRRVVPNNSALNTLRLFEGSPIPSQLPSPRALARIPSSTLRAFGKAVMRERLKSLNKFRQTGVSAGSQGPEYATALHRYNDAVVGLSVFEMNITVAPVGMLNLERIEMTPVGIQRGELIATIPLAPLEQTAVVHKEWSVTSKEFTSIITDSLENYSETGVTENTELAQSTSSQTSHSNQFNINATVSGGYGPVTATVATGFSGQDQNSTSATESAKHAIATTRKASARVKQEHKVTISTTTVTGTSETSTRVLQNPSATDPMRIDYFSIMRKWHVGLYRYGLRLTYDIAIPEPGATMRKLYAQIDELKNKIGPFDFQLKFTDITRDNWKDLEANYGMPLPPPPIDSIPAAPDGSRPAVPYRVSFKDEYKVEGDTSGTNVHVIPLDLPEGYVVASDDPDPDNPDPDQKDFAVILHAEQAIGGTQKGFIDSFIDVIQASYVMFTDPDTGLPTRVRVVKNTNASGPPVPVMGWNTIAHLDYLKGRSGKQYVQYEVTNSSSGSVRVDVILQLTDAGLATWQQQVWNTLYNAAQTQYYAQQQDYQATLAALEDQISNVDTLTLRREENEEIMKGILRWLLGPSFDFMPPDVIGLFEKRDAHGKLLNQIDLSHGTCIDSGNGLAVTSQSWMPVLMYGEMVKFINEAIEWENILYFLYSYFWDVPPSWDFIRQIKHPDSTRQAFLRAGSARVVLPIRRGWEDVWVNFVEAGGFGENILPDHPYMSIAQQIQAYDYTNYPGIPPANPGGGPLPDEGDYVATVSGDKFSPPLPSGPVTIKVKSSDGFIVGYTAVIDSYDSGKMINGQFATFQEARAITAIPDATHITVDGLKQPHDGSTTPFPIMQAGEKGQLVAEWFEYTPTSGTDIAVTSNLATIA